MIPYIAELRKGAFWITKHQPINLTISSQLLATEAGLSWELLHQDQAHLPAMLVGWYPSWRCWKGCLWIAIRCHGLDEIIKWTMTTITTPGYRLAVNVNINKYQPPLFESFCHCLLFIFSTWVSSVLQGAVAFKDRQLLFRPILIGSGIKRPFDSIGDLGSKPTWATKDWNLHKLATSCNILQSCKILSDWVSYHVRTLVIYQYLPRPTSIS